jgi:translation elongation factor EF-1alpha
VGGKLESGALRVGSKVMLLPGGEVGAVRALEVNGQVRRG